MIKRLHYYGLIVSMFFAIASCGTGGNFSKSKSRGLRKVRTGQKPVASTSQAEETTQTVYETELSQPTFKTSTESTIETSQPEKTPIDNVESDAQDFIVIDTTTKETPTIAEIFKQQKAQTSEAFNGNHYGTLFTFIAGLVAGALGFGHYNVLGLILSFIFFCAAFALALLMKYRIASRQKGTDDDNKYSNRLWLANFVFYSSMFLILISLIAFLAILVL